MPYDVNDEANQLTADEGGQLADMVRRVGMSPVMAMIARILVEIDREGGPTGEVEEN